MTTKEKIITKSINTITKRLIKIDAILNANPLRRIFDIRQEANDLLEENKGIEKRTSKSFIDKIDVLAKEEKQQMALALKQTKNSDKLIDEKVKLGMELTDLKNEEYRLKR